MKKEALNLFNSLTKVILDNNELECNVKHCDQCKSADVCLECRFLYEITDNGLCNLNKIAIYVAIVVVIVTVFLIICVHRWREKKNRQDLDNIYRKETYAKVDLDVKNYQCTSDGASDAERVRDKNKAMDSQRDVQSKDSLNNKIDGRLQKESLV